MCLTTIWKWKFVIMWTHFMNIRYLVVLDNNLWGFIFPHVYCIFIIYKIQCIKYIVHYVKYNNKNENSTDQELLDAVIFPSVCAPALYFFPSPDIQFVSILRHHIFKQEFKIVIFQSRCRRWWMLVYSLRTLLEKITYMFSEHLNKWTCCFT
jgi:hypothetical protein